MTHDPMLFGGAPLARRDDPGTSKQAAIAPAIQRKDAEVMVAMVMADGTPRIDEEIHQTAVIAFDYDKTDGRTRHGRLALVKAGLIKATGRRRPTAAGSQATEWIKA